MDGGKTEPEIQLLTGMETRKQLKLDANAMMTSLAMKGKSNMIQFNLIQSSLLSDENTEIFCNCDTRGENEIDAGLITSKTQLPITKVKLNLIQI